MERALVPIENSLEGSVNATLDALAFETASVQITGELVHPIHHCLIARDAGAARADRRGRLAPAGQRPVRHLHPHAARRAPRWCRPPRRPTPCGSSPSATATATPWAAIGSRAAAELYGCAVLESGVEDPPGSETRFVWIAPRGAGPGGGRRVEDRADVLGAGRRPPGLARALPGRVRRPRRQPHPHRVAAAPRGPRLVHVLRRSRRPRRTTRRSPRRSRRCAPHAEGVRVLGSFPAAP